MAWLAIRVAAVLGVAGVGGGVRGPHHPRDHGHYVPQPGGPKLTQDTRLLHDSSHIQEDLEELARHAASLNMTPAEMEFHYFKLHDYDNNSQLDGLEMLQAIQHTVEHAGSQEPSTSLEYLVELIDRVLEEDDLDQNGLLSYAEFMVGRERADPSPPPPPSL